MSFAIVNHNDYIWNLKTKVEFFPNSIDIVLPNFREKKADRYAKKVIKILNKEKIKEVVLNNDILKNKKFCESLISAKKQIITGKRMYKAIILRVLKDIAHQINYDFFKLKVALLINDYCTENIDLIKTIAKEVKTLNIVTIEKDLFNMLEKELFNNYGIVLKVVEKDIVNLKNVDAIVNVDFSSWDMNRLNVNNNSLIICGFAENYEVKKNFDGIIIRKIEIVDPENTEEKIDDLALCEAKIYSYLRKLKQNDAMFEREGFKLNGYLGENGKLTSQDFKKYGQKNM